MSDHKPDPVQCVDCGKVRTDEVDYNPVQVLFQKPLGWYSAPDGEFCPDCLTEIVLKANS